MDFDLRDLEPLRHEVRDFIAQNWSRDQKYRADRGEAYEEECALRRELGRRGWLAPSWPKEYGGGGRSFWESVVIAEEFQYGGVHTGSSAVSVVGPTIQLVGSDEQKQRFLPAIAQGEIDFALGYTEPDAGSDLASLKTRAVRDGDEFVINGAKVFTSLATRAEYCWLAARTDPEAPKHRGISVFIVDMKTPGIEVRPLWTMGERRTNATFWEDVRVPAANLIGELNRGWYYISSALDFERLAYYCPHKVEYIFDELTDYLRSPAAASLREDHAVRTSVARNFVDLTISKALYWRAASMISHGQVPNYEASMTKLFQTELLQRVSRDGANLLGAAGQMTPAAPAAPLGGFLEFEHRYHVYETFGGGSSELMRNIIATRGMGLPR
jgi:alkylation response protein AidB-like acyl-CoA dehydrogenase